MKIFFNLQVFLWFFKNNAKMLRKTLQVAKACNDVFMMYAKIVMFFYQTWKKNDLKNFRRGNFLNFFYYLAKIWDSSLNWFKV